jgi:hypothetical protein
MIHNPEVLARLAQARATVRKAKNALRAAEREYDADCSYGDGNLRLIAKIRAAERRLQLSRAELRQLDPASSE